MTDEEEQIYEFMLTCRGSLFSVREISRAVDRKRADKELRWAFTSLKRLALKEKIVHTNEGFYTIPIQEEEKKDKDKLGEAAVFVPGSAWCGSLLAGLVPLITGLDLLGLNVTETMFLTKTQVAGAPSEAKSTVPPAIKPRPAEPPRAETPAVVPPVETFLPHPSAKPNPFDGIVFIRQPKSLPPSK